MSLKYEPPQAFPAHETPAPFDPEAGPSETHNLTTSILEKPATAILETPAAEGGEARERGQIDGQNSAGEEEGRGTPAWKWESLERDGPLVLPSSRLSTFAALERGNACAKSHRCRQKSTRR